MIIPLLLGLLSSLHCVAMCGPIALALPVHHLPARQKVQKILVYHFGRISTYVLLGGLFGALGKGLFIAGFQQNVSIVLGVLLILFVLFFKERYLSSKFLIHSKAYLKFKKLFGSFLQKKTTGAFFVLGFLNGLLPCAMIYTALFGATATQGTLYGGWFMLWYGLGTLPLLLAVVWVGQWARQSFQKKIQKVTSVFLILTGLLLIVRGSGMDIPLVSPTTLQLFITRNPHCF